MVSISWWMASVFPEPGAPTTMVCLHLALERVRDPGQGRHVDRRFCIKLRGAFAPGKPARSGRFHRRLGNPVPLRDRGGVEGLDLLDQVAESGDFLTADLTGF